MLKEQVRARNLEASRKPSRQKCWRPPKGYRPHLHGQPWHPMKLPGVVRYHHRFFSLGMSRDHQIHGADKLPTTFKLRPDQGVFMSRIQRPGADLKAR